jgi:hypothetical protein
MLIVPLTWAEVHFADVAASMRSLVCRKTHRQQKYGASNDEQLLAEFDRIGCLAEEACAKCLNLYWSGLCGAGVPDVGFKYQVRGTWRMDGRLILHPDDKDDEPFILVTPHDTMEGGMLTFRLVGWILCRDGKQEKYWTDPKGDRPAFFVPQDALHPMETLPDEVWQEAAE